MIDLRAARSDPDRFRAALARRGADAAFDELLAADERWRELVPQVDELRGRQKLKGKPTAEQLEELKQVKDDLRRLEEELTATEAERDRLALQIPNVPHESVPDGATEEDAVEVRRAGEPPDLGEPREHTEIGRFDMERAARLSGSRFGYLIGDTALLAFALYHYALDRIATKGFTPVLPPVLVREEALVGTGHFPSDEQSVYEIPADELYLSGTAEIPLSSLHAGEILSAEELPLRYVAFSPCFRREAGAAGRDTRGMFRVHQFNKVEQFSFTQPTSPGTSLSGCSRTPRRSFATSACRIESSSCLRETCLLRRRRPMTSSSGFRARTVIAREPRSRTRRTFSPVASTSARAPTVPRARCIS